MIKLLFVLKDGGSSAKKQDVPRSKVKSRCKPCRNPEPLSFKGHFGDVLTKGLVVGENLQRDTEYKFVQDPVRSFTNVINQSLI